MQNSRNAKYYEALGTPKYTYACNADSASNFGIPGTYKETLGTGNRDSRCVKVLQ